MRGDVKTHTIIIHCFKSKMYRSKLKNGSNQINRKSQKKKKKNY